MAIVKKKRITWDGSPDADVVAHRIYVVKEGETLQQGISPSTAVDMPTLEIILPDAFPPGTFDMDVNYQVAISAVDDVGNESDAVVVSHPFDFIAPAPPSNISVENWVG